MPNGPSFITDRNSDGGKTPQKPDTGWMINDGPAPHGIMRRFQANDRGIIGDDMRTWPTTGSEEYVPHRAIVRNPRGTANRDGIPTSDPTAYVPAFAVGDAR